jgi:hypothetical protein
MQVSVMDKSQLLQTLTRLRPAERRAAIEVALHPLQQGQE